MIKGEGTTSDPFLFRPMDYIDVEEMTEIETRKDYLVITIQDTDDGEQYAIGIPPLYFELMAKKGLAIINGEDL